MPARNFTLGVWEQNPRPNRVNVWDDMGPGPYAPRKPRPARTEIVLCEPCGRAFPRSSGHMESYCKAQREKRRHDH